MGKLASQTVHSSLRQQLQNEHEAAEKPLPPQLAYGNALFCMAQPG